MARIAYYVHGRGRGHASRALSVVPQLVEQGHDIQVMAGGSASHFLSKHLPVTEVRPCLPGDPTRVFVERTFSDRRQLRDYRAELVISDGDAPSVHAALFAHLPSLAIGHGLVFGHCKVHGPPWMRLEQAAVAASSSWPSRYRVAVHFAPAEVRFRRTFLARPDMPARQAATDYGAIVCYFRDENGAPLLRLLGASGRPVVVYGDHDPHIAGVEFRTVNRQRFAASLQGCAGVVGSAGNQLISECAFFGKPILALYKPGDGEQRLNALELRRWGIGQGCEMGPEAEQAIGRFLNNLGNQRPVSGLHDMVPVSKVVPSVVAKMTV